MSKISIHNIIKSTLKIDRLTHDQLKACVFELLEKNPILISKHFLNIDTIEKNIIPTKTDIGEYDAVYYVVFNSMPDDKIRVIKAIRSFFFSGLAESKNWVEGIAVSHMEAPGVLGGPVNKYDAERIIDKMRKIDGGLAVRLTRITTEEYKTYNFKHF